MFVLLLLILWPITERLAPTTRSLSRRGIVRSFGSSFVVQATRVGGPSRPDDVDSTATDVERARQRR